jgi:PHD/YefM family antitoxin component YafN of YafNO toxin-antitoxin module
MQVINIPEAQTRLVEIHEQVIAKHEPIILTHQQQDIVLIAREEWESNQETLRLFQDRAALKSLLESFEEHDQGNTVGNSIEEVFSDLL